MHSRYTIILVVGFLAIAACDPCRELAEKICQCREGDDEKRQCTSDLNLASQHEYFSNAKELHVCEAALKKNCSCEALNNSDDAECGMYRLSRQ